MRACFIRWISTPSSCLEHWGRQDAAQLVAVLLDFAQLLEVTVIVLIYDAGEEHGQLVFRDKSCGIV